MRRASLAALLLVVGCAAAGPELGPWSVAGTASSADAVQALAVVDAARRAMGPGSLDFANQIHLQPDIDYPCGYRWPEAGQTWHFAGCVGDGVWILWPHPKRPGCTDLAACSALAHELCHVATGSWGNDEASHGRVAACELLVLAELRRGVL